MPRSTTLLATALALSAGLAAQTPSAFLHVDQFGYLPDAEKVLVVSDPQEGFNAADDYTPGPVLEVRDADTDALVYSGAPEVWNGGQTDPQSGDRGWWFDFSSVTAPGSYVVVDPSTGARSARF